jgi:hypothetical protein
VRAADIPLGVKFSGGVGWMRWGLTDSVRFHGSRVNQPTIVEALVG